MKMSQTSTKSENLKLLFCHFSIALINQETGSHVQQHTPRPGFINADPKLKPMVEFLDFGLLWSFFVFHFLYKKTYECKSSSVHIKYPQYK